MQLAVLTRELTRIVLRSFKSMEFDVTVLVATIFMKGGMPSVQLNDDLVKQKCLTLIIHSRAMREPDFDRN